MGTRAGVVRWDGRGLGSTCRFFRCRPRSVACGASLSRLSGRGTEGEGHVARQRRIRIRPGAHPPQQRVGLQARAAAGCALGVAAVARQQHADVHLVRLALQPGEIALDAVPLLLPLAGPLRLALHHPLAMRRLHQLPRRVQRHAELRRELLQVALALLETLGLPRLDGAFAQRLALVGDHQAEVEADHPAEAPARLARTQRGVEREGAGIRLRVMDVAIGAVQIVAEAQRRAFGVERRASGVRPRAWRALVFTLNARPSTLD